MEVVDLRNRICEIIGPKGLAPPDWTTIKRWKEKLGEIGWLCDDGIRAFLEMRYGEEFGAEGKLVGLPTVAKMVGRRDPYMLKDSMYRCGLGGWIMKIGNQYYMRKEDAERLCQMISSGEWRERWKRMRKEGALLKKPESE